jgi:hypothetical protein
LAGGGVGGTGGGVGGTGGGVGGTAGGGVVGLDLHSKKVKVWFEPLAKRVPAVVPIFFQYSGLSS